LDFEDTFEMLDFSNAENQKKSKKSFFSFPASGKTSSTVRRKQLSACVHML